jgi:hypothetical protein
MEKFLATSRSGTSTDTAFNSQQLEFSQQHRLCHRNIKEISLVCDEIGIQKITISGTHASIQKIIIVKDYQRAEKIVFGRRKFGRSRKFD